MARVGYRRVSTSEQRLDRQDLSDCEKVFEEQASAGTRHRQALADMIDWVREGDEVVVWSIDRLEHFPIMLHHSLRRQSSFGTLRA